MRPLLTFLLLFIMIYLLSDIFVKYFSFGLFPNQVRTTLFGDIKEFIDPIIEAEFLEFWHAEIFFAMMVLFTLSTIYIRLTQASKLAIFIVNLMMISALLCLVSLPLAYYAWAPLVNLYVLSFFLWHLSTLFAALHAIKRFYFA